MKGKNYRERGGREGKRYMEIEGGVRKKREREMKERKVGRKIEGEREKGKWREGGRGNV